MSDETPKEPEQQLEQQQQEENAPTQEQTSEEATTQEGEAAAEEAPAQEAEGEGEGEGEAAGEGEGEGEGEEAGGKVEGSEDMPWDAMAGKWKIVKDENLNAFLKAMKANALVKKMAGAAKPKFTQIVDGAKFTVSVHIAIKKVGPYTFVVNGEELTEADAMGNKMMVKTTWADGKMVMEMTPKKEGKGEPHSVTREIVGDELHLTMQCHDATCKRIMHRCA